MDSQQPRGLNGNSLTCFPSSGTLSDWMASPSAMTDTMATLVAALTIGRRGEVDIDVG